VSGLPREVDQLLAVLLSRDPGARHPSARDLAAELAYLELRYGLEQGPAQTARLARSLRAYVDTPSGEASTRSVSHSRAQPIAVPRSARPAAVGRAKGS
jgi:hypothetical protein